MLTNFFGTATSEIFSVTIASALGYAISRAYSYFNYSPHVVIKYKNGSTKMILYEGKSDSKIVEEIHSAISDGDVILVTFKN